MQDTIIYSIWRTIFIFLSLSFSQIFSNVLSSSAHLIHLRRRKGDIGASFQSPWTYLDYQIIGGEQTKG